MTSTDLPVTGTNLPARRLGRTEMTISTTGFGAWAIGGGDWRYGWGPQDDSDSIAAIRRAVESGVNWIDTAAVYGLGHSEQVVGAAIGGYTDADRPFIFTKCGLVWDEDNPASAPRKIMNAASVRREVENSLRRLNVEQIDLYQVHWPGDGLSLDWVGDPTTGTSTDATPLEQYWQTMAELKAEGKVAAIALSNHSLAQLETAERFAHVDAIQPQFSALARGSAPEIAWAAANDTGVIVYQPMHSGLLSGAFSRDRVTALADADWRKSAPDFTTDLDRNLAVTDALRVVAERRGASVPAVAVAWALAWPGVTAAIVGARNPRQVDGWVPGAELGLTGADLDEIAVAITTSGAGTGPIRP